MNLSQLAFPITLLIMISGCARASRIESLSPVVPLGAQSPGRAQTLSLADIPNGALRIVNYATRIGGIASGSDVTAYGSGLAGANVVTFTLQYGGYGYPISYATYDTTLFEAADDHVSVILPAVAVPVDWWGKLQVYHQDDSGARTLLAEQNLYLESAAPGFFTADGTGTGIALGNSLYTDLTNWNQTPAGIDQPIRAPRDNEQVSITLWGTGAIPADCDNSAMASVVVTTALGSMNVPIMYLGTAGAGYQQLNVDLTDFLKSDIAQTTSARLYLRVLGCQEQASDGQSRFVDSNDVTLSLATTDQPVTPPTPGDPWAGLSAQAPLTSFRIGGQHLTSVAPWAYSKGPWEYRAQSVRDSVLRGANLSPLPEKTPLNPIFSRVRMRDGYSVENVAFEASPGFFVTGNLFKPLHRAGPVPGILVAHGHFGNWAGYARTREENQLLATRLAQMGAVVFTYDMIGWGDSQQLDHRDDGHSFKDGTHNNLLKLQLWDSIRSVDFLESLVDARGAPLVDSTRIAVTGASGGATQALYLAAVDSRISAAAEVVMITAGFTGNDSCEDGMPVHDVPGQQKTNNTEIAATIAPKPLMILSDTSDWTQWFPTDEYPYMKQVYGLYGQGDHVLNWHYNDAHNYLFSKRTRAYDFFAAALGLERIPDGGAPYSDQDNHENVRLERESSLHVYSPAFPKPAIPMQHL